MTSVKSVLVFLTCTALLACCTSQPPSHTSRPDQTVSRYDRSHLRLSFTTIAVDRKLEMCITVGGGKPVCNIMKDGFTASGVIVDKTPKHFDVLTANHICEDHVGTLEKTRRIGDVVYKGVGTTTIAVTDYTGHKFDKEITEVVGVDTSKDGDLCLVRVKENTDDLSIQAAQLANQPPRYGDSVFNVGAPHSVHSDSAPLIFHGIFAGSPDTRDIYIVTSYTQPGSSGSGVFTIDGKLFMMIHEYTPQLEHGAGKGATLANVRKFLCEHVIATSKPRFLCGASQ